MASARGTAILLAVLPLMTAAAPSGVVEVRIEKLRNLRGEVHLCLTADAKAFPDCKKDPRAVVRTLPARQAGLVRLEGLAPGEYAIALFHDENSNKKLDTFLAIPREGFGFSRNPAVRFGPPAFRQASFIVDAGIARLTVRMQYLL